jgi:hypothetical protein
MKASFIIFCLTSLVLMSAGLQKAAAQPPVLPSLSMSSVFHAPLSDTAKQLLSPVKDSLPTLPAKNHLPLNFYSTHLGTACKLEWQLEKQTKLPLRIRLGSKDQVDYLEGKYIRH